VKHVALLLWLVVAVSPSAFAETPSYRTADEAIAIAKWVCADLIPRDKKVGWGAVRHYEGIGGWHGPGEDGRAGWHVDGGYDASRPGVLSLIDIHVFIPDFGEPEPCTAVSN
jgi:hypothetical protein